VRTTDDLRTVDHICGEGTSAGNLLETKCHSAFLKALQNCEHMVGLLFTSLYAEHDRLSNAILMLGLAIW
jgi:hypothetical protein